MRSMRRGMVKGMRTRNEACPVHKSRAVCNIVMSCHIPLIVTDWQRLVLHFFGNIAPGNDYVVRKKVLFNQNVSIPRFQGRWEFFTLGKWSMCSNYARHQRFNAVFCIHESDQCNIWSHQLVIVILISSICHRHQWHIILTSRGKSVCSIHCHTILEKSELSGSRARVCGSGLEAEGGID